MDGDRGWCRRCLGRGAAAEVHRLDTAALNHREGHSGVKAAAENRFRCGDEAIRLRATRLDAVTFSCTLSMLLLDAVTVRWSGVLVEILTRFDLSVGLSDGVSHAIVCSIRI